MQSHKVTGNPKTVQRSVLTSLSLLVSTNCVLANAPGFPNHSQAPQSSWQSNNAPQFHVSASSTNNGTGLASPNAHPVFAHYAGVQHNHQAPNPTFAAHQAAQSAWQSYGLAPDSLQALTTGNFNAPNQGYQLDLSSTTANVVLGTKLFNGAPSVTVDIGGQSVSFRPGAQVTAAEYVAIKEVLSGGQQSIVLNSGGTAVGGTFSLNQVITPKVTELVIPQSVTALDYFSGNKPVTIHGDLVNFGSIYGISTNPAVTSGSIFAHDITNEAGGLITTQLPSAMSSSIADVVSGVSLILGASNNLTNSGTISSAGHLTLATLNGAITNNASATLSAAQNVNLLPGTGNVNNAGTIAAASGNINIAALNQSNNININAAGGTFSALNGAINVRDASYDGDADINMEGGNYQSQSLNLYGGNGAITGSVGEVSGTLNTSGNAAHFAADTKLLVLGNNCLKGDPTFANAGGDIKISGAVVAAEDLTIIASGNITADPGSSLSTANVQVSGVPFSPSTNITLIAGATVTLTPGSTTTTTLPGNTSIGSGKTATVDFSSGNGGNIDLQGASIDTSSNLSFLPPSGFYNQPNGGNVLLVAYANGATGGNVSTGTIDTRSLSGNGGNVTVIAGAAPSTPATTTVDLGDIHTGSNGSSNDVLGSGGNVSIYTQQPTAATGSTIVFNNDGSVSSGKVVPAGPVSPNAVVKLTTIDTTTTNFFSSPSQSTTGGDIKIVAGGVDLKVAGGGLVTQAEQSGAVYINAVGAVNANGNAIDTSAINGNNVVHSGNITIEAGSAILGDLNAGNTSASTATGGKISVTTVDNLVTATIDAGSSGLSGADVVLSAGGDLQVNSVNPGSAITGRNIVLGGVEGVSVNAAGGAATTAILATGSVTAIAGSSKSPAAISITGGISTKASRSGGVEIVNNSPTTSAVNVTVGGTIATDSNAKNGAAGGVSVVSSGAIKLANISATSLVANNTGASGGGVFISSGGTGANAITVGTVNTSATAAAGNVGGNIIMISPGSKTATNPTNIKHGTVTLNGGQKGVALFASIDSKTPDTIPATINITTTITGPNAINIKPGGYQSAQSLTSFTINNSNLNMTVPVNVSSSLDVKAITQANGNDSYSLATGGNLVFNSNFASSAQTKNISLLSLGGIEAKNASNINISSQNSAVLFGQSGITADGLTVTAFNDITVGGFIDTSSAAGNGHQVTLNSAIGSISTDNISTFGTGIGATSGGVTLVALGSVSAGNIDSSSHDGISGFNTTGAGNITMVAGTGSGSTNNAIRTGDLLNSGSGLINLSAAGNRSTIKTGDIVSAYSTTGSIDSVVINGNGFVRTGDITTSATTGNSGSVAISMGQTGAQLGVIDTSSSIGAVAGNITIYGGGANSTISLQSLNASTNGVNQPNGSGGNVLITNSGGNLTWAQGGINASANFTGLGNGNAGSVLISVDGSLYGTSIQASSAGTSGNGGTVLVSGGERVFISTIDTSAFSGSASSGNGGNVTIACSSRSAGGINTTAITTRGISQGGSISEIASGFIVNNGAVDTTSNSTGGSFSAVTNSIFYSPSSIKTAASNTTSASATGGNVMIAVSSGNVSVGNAIDTSATSKSGPTLGGSIGITANTTIDAASMNASSTTTTGPATSIAGDIFLSAGGDIGAAAKIAMSATANGGGVVVQSNNYLGSGSSTFNFTGDGSKFTQFTSGSNITTANATITVTVLSTNIVPGVYSSIGTAKTPVNLTLDFGGDSRLLVPLVSAGPLPTDGGVYLSGLTADNKVVGGTLPFAVNGYDAHFLATTGSTADSTQISGNLTSNPASGGTAGNIQFFDLNGSISQTAGLISANHLTLQGFTGIGTTASFPRTVKAINTDAAFISAATFSNPASTYDVNITTPSTVVTSLDGINIASGNNAKFNLTSTGTGALITVASNSILMGSLTTIKATGAATSTAVSGTVVGYDEFAKTTIQASVLNVSSTGRVSASAILIDTTDVTNDGLISTTTGTLAVNNSSVTSPNLTISGTGTMTSATALSISAGGNIDFGGLIKGGSLTMQPGESLTIVAGGNITATAAGGGNFSINTSSTGGNGGNVIMMAGVNYTFPTGVFNDLTVTTSSLASTTGGSIFLDGSKNANGLKLNNIDTTSTGGAGGDVMFIAQGPSATDDVILLPTNGKISTGGATANGDVAFFALGPTLTGTGKAVAVGDINTGGAGFASNSGGIDLESCTLVPGGNISTQTLVFSNGTFSTNNQPGVIPQTRTGGKGTVTSGKLATNNGYLFVEGESDVNVLFDSSATLNANDIEIKSINGVLNLPVDTLTANAFADGSGGIIVLSAPTIVYANSGTNPLILTANALDNSSGSGGTVEYITTNSNPISFGKAAGNIQMYAHSGLTGGDGGTVFVTNGGDLGLDSKFYDAAARGANGSGSYFHFEGKNVTINGLALNQPFVINANGVGTGSGGAIELFQTNATPIDVNSKTYLFTATSGLLGGSGGYVDFRTGGDLKVDPTQIKVNPLGKTGDGGTVKLTAGTQAAGNLLVTAPLVANGKGTGSTGGFVSLTSNSPTTFTVGGKAGILNGTIGAPSVTGTADNGSIWAINNGGGVQNLVALTAVKTLLFQVNGTGDITIGASIGKAGVTNTFLENRGTGDITNTSKTMTVQGNFVYFETNNDVIGASNTPFTISAPSTRIQKAANANISDKLSFTIFGASGGLPLPVANILTLTGSKNIIIGNEIDAPTLNITAAGFVGAGSAATLPANIKSDNLSIGGGTVNLNNLQSTTINVNAVNKTKSFTFSSAGDIAVPNPIGSTTTIMALTALNNANINTTGLGGMIVGKSVDLNTTGAGTGAVGSAGAVQVNAATVTGSSLTSINLALNSATTTLGNLTANNGNIDINTSGVTAKVIQTFAATTKLPGATIKANNGHLTFQNNNLKSGSIVIGKGSQISTTGAGGQDVTISIGKAGSNQGTAPTGVLYTVDGKSVTPPNAHFSFGTNGITVAGTKTGAETISLNTIGTANVIFDTGSLKATAIKINGNTTANKTTITADPPISTSDLEASNITAPTIHAVETLIAPTPLITFSPSSSTTFSAPAVTTNAVQTNTLLPTQSFSVQTPANLIASSSLNQTSVLTSQALLAAGRRSAGEAVWASETELTSGEIPAVVYSQEDLGVHSDQTTVLELTADSDSDATLSNGAKLLPGNRLQGEVTKRVDARSSRVALNRGAVVFAPTSDTIVETPMGKVSVAADSLVLVTVGAQGTAVYDLDDSHHKAVTVQTGGKEVALAPGRHILLTKNANAAFAELNPAQMIAYRNIREHGTIGETRAFTAEFSVAHALRVVQPLKQMLNCKNGRSQKIAAHLLKTMSIMMSLENNRTSYQQVFKPRATAYLQ